MSTYIFNLILLKMRTEIYDFLHRGYFPKELPKSFNTYLFAINYESINSEWKNICHNPSNRVQRIANETITQYDERIKSLKKPVSVPTPYSFAKGDVSRRDLSVLNPVNFLPLAIYIRENWNMIDGVINKSAYSQSKPTYDTNIKKRCYRASSPSVSSLMEYKILQSKNSKIEVKVDISNFYPSIYTHSISWALLGKTKAKEMWRKHGDKPILTPADEEEKLYNLSYKLDHYVEQCQDKQTHGIPIGPDSSFVVAELIATYVDVELRKKFHTLKGYRYYDDYTLYTSTYEEAMSIIREIQSIMSVLELTVNESKIEITLAPKPFLEDYAEKLSPFQFDSSKTSSVLVHYFNLLWKLCDLHPRKTDTIIKYGLKPLINSKLVITDSVKELFESLLYKTALMSPSSLEQVHNLIKLKGLYPTESSLTALLCDILSCHAPLCHHHEVAWALWLCKIYNLPIEESHILAVFKMQNAICTLILLDYLNNNSAATSFKEVKTIQEEIRQIESHATAVSLFNEDWILVYEGACHGWLKTEHLVKANPFFDFIFEKNISFYDPNNAADYTSYDYIETLPADIYPQDMRKKAKALRQEVMGKAYAQIFDEIESHELEESNVKFLKRKYKDKAKDIDIEKDVFGKILSEIFRREAPDLDKYVEYVVDELKVLSFY